MSEQVFSRRNLGSGEAWGREVEQRFFAIDKDQTQTKQQLNNSNRSFSGQLAVLTNQVDELYDREILTQPMPDFGVSGNATAEPFPVGSNAITIPGTGTGRSSLVAVNAVFNDGFPSSGSALYVEITVDGAVTARTNVTGSGRPAGWDMGSISVMFPAIIRPEGSELQMNLYRVGFTTVVSTWTASRINVSTYYGDKV